MLLSQAAVGAPDSNLATVVGILGQRLVLDLGAGEEGTGNLVVTYGGIGTALHPTVELLDVDFNPLATVTLDLLDVYVGTHTATVPYANAAAPYRYVRFYSLLAVYGIDAVRATTVRPDSDGDGLPDTWQLLYGLDPLSTTGPNGAGGDPDGDGVRNSAEYRSGTDPSVPNTSGTTPTVYLPNVSR